jgi:hypothetical protein
MGTSMERAITLKNIFRILAFMGLTASLSSCLPASNAGKYTVESLQTELDRALPKGTDMAKVDSYLADRGFGSSGLIDNAEMAHMGFDPETYELRSIIRETGKSLLVTTDIAMVFTFDREKKLKNIAVNEVHTGL